MPNYDFTCTSCDTGFERQLPIAERRRPESEPCPTCEASTVILAPSAPGIGDATRIRGRAGFPDGWKDRLRTIKSKFPGSTIDV